MRARSPEPAGRDVRPDLHLAMERMTDLHEEARAVRRTSWGQAGVLTALRDRLGRALIALGSAIAPDGSRVSRPARRP
jgi:hypothetical protein